MSDRLTEALEAGLAALTGGEDPNIWLAQNSEVASELRPMLLAAEAVGALPVEAISGEGFQRTRSRILARAAQLRKREPARRWSLWSLNWVQTSLAILFVLFFSAVGLVAASANTIPGDQLYPFKRAVEDLSLNLAPSTQIRNDLIAAYQQRRLDELRELTRLGEDELATQLYPETQPTMAGTAVADVDGSDDEARPEPTAAAQAATAQPSSEAAAASATLLATVSPAVSASARPSLTPNTTPSATPPADASCAAITIYEWDFQYVKVEVEDDEEHYEYDDGGRLRFHVRNDNEADAYLTNSTLQWNTAHAPPIYLDYFRFKGERYYQADSTTSPVSSAAPMIELDDSKWWEAVFFVDDQPFEGSFSVTLTFNIEGIGDCTVSAQAQLP